jgi:hypothetical protein
VILIILPLGYVTDERCSLGEKAERVRWTKKRGFFCAAVKLRKQFGHRERASKREAFVRM